MYNQGRNQSNEVTAFTNCRNKNTFPFPGGLREFSVNL